MATKEDIKRFVEDYLRIENEKQLLAEDLKELFEDMKERTDIKALKAAQSLCLTMEILYCILRLPILTALILLRIRSETATGARTQQRLR